MPIKKRPKLTLEALQSVNTYLDYLPAPAVAFTEASTLAATCSE